MAHVELSEPHPQLSAAGSISGGGGLCVLHVPQSVQSVPSSHRNESHIPSHAHVHESLVPPVYTHMSISHVPQSEQSVPVAQMLYSLPGEPSSQSPSQAALQEFTA